MNLRAELDRIADSASPLSPDAADRALTKARRQRRYVQAPLVMATIALAVVGGLAIRPNLVGTDIMPAAPWGKRIEIPATADNLPAQGVGPARLAYVWSCRASQAVTPDCVEARIMTEDNKHWAVPDARPSTNSGETPYQEAISVSPDGNQIAYIRGDWIVLRDLASGKVTPLFELAATSYRRAMWSPDSKALAFNLTVRDKSQTKLVDTVTGKVTATLKDGWIMGLPNAGALTPFDTLPTPEDLTMVDRTGAAQGTIPNAFTQVRHRGGATGLISPGGGHVAVVMGPEEELDQRVRAVRVDPPKVPVWIGNGFEDDKADRDSILGWLDDERILIASDYLGPTPWRQKLTVFEAETERSSPFTEIVGYTIQDSISVATDLL